MFGSSISSTEFVPSFQALAINGGSPVRTSFLPYATHWVGEEEKEQVLSVLNSGWLTTGPKVKQFEEDMARYVGVKYALAVNSGTAALHCCLAALDIQPGDEVITTPFTFLATANAILYLGGRPVLADIDEKTYNLDPIEIRKKITPKTKAIIPVHYGGLPCEMDEILAIAGERGLKIIEDAAHAFSAQYRGRNIGSIGDATIFSFHPVKNITTAEGGMIMTNDPEIAKRCVMHRTHGITREAMERYGKDADWTYDMQRLGYRYNMTEFQAALGIAQLKKIDFFQRRREEIAACYDQEFSSLAEVILPPRLSHARSSWHLYPIRLRTELLTVDRNHVLTALKAENIGVNVHYIPIHLHSYYQQKFGFARGDFPITEKIYDTILTLPFFPKMSEADVQDVITAVKKVLRAYRKKTLSPESSPNQDSLFDKSGYFSGLKRGDQSLEPSVQPYGPPSPIFGETIRLVPFANKHLFDERYLAWLRDPEVMILARRDYSSEFSLEDAQKYAHSIWKSKTDYFFAIEMQSDGAFVGTFKIGHIDWDKGIADLGIIIGEKKLWGKGLATEACRLGVAHCFKDLDLHKVIIGCKEPNLGMISVARKLGFRQEGYLREQNFYNGQWCGHYYFGLLKKEYEQNISREN